MDKILRRPWTQSDREKLIHDWESMGSVWLIAIHTRRSKASVRAQASRMGLGKRTSICENSRTPWREEELDLLRVRLQESQKQGGEILIVELAKELNRDIDAVMDKLSKSFDSEQKLQESIIVTRYENNNAFNRPKIKDRRKVKMNRKCMTCGGIFFSDGAHNRICNPCKDSDGLIDWD